jgi:hypothetical protein
METSFVAGQEGFSTLVHVPLIDMKSALTIWEHHILPIPLSHGLYLNLGPADYTHIFAAADDGFSRSENDYTVSYVWPFDPLTLTPGLDTKKFNAIIKRNLTRLANNTRHNIPLEVALQGEAAGLLGGFNIGRDQVATKNYPRGAPVAINMVDMMERR